MDDDAEAAVVLNNYFGRQFNSLNDVAVNIRNKDIYFTDVTYGYFQDFRPPPALPNQVYRFTESTGAITVVADGFRSPNGQWPSDTDPTDSQVSHSLLMEPTPTLQTPAPTRVSSASTILRPLQCKSRDMERVDRKLPLHGAR